MSTLIEKDGKLYKQAKVVMLPTNNKSCIHNTGKQLRYITPITGVLPNSSFYNLYIIDDSKIKEGDWFLSDDRNHISEAPRYRVEQCVKIKNGWIFGSIDKMGQGHNPDWSKKIIATTDSLKWMESRSSNKRAEVDFLLPSLSKSFIEAYIREYNKGNVITDILVEVEDNTYMSCPSGKYHDDEPTLMLKNLSKPMYPLKLSSSNEIIIKRVEPKVYTEEQLLHFVHEAWMKGALQYQNPKKEQSYTDFIEQILKY